MKRNVRERRETLLVNDNDMPQFCVVMWLVSTLTLILLRPIQSSSMTSSTVLFLTYRKVPGFSQLARLYRNNQPHPVRNVLPFLGVWKAANNFILAYLPYYRLPRVTAIDPLRHQFCSQELISALSNREEAKFSTANLRVRCFLLTLDFFLMYSFS